MTNKVKGIRHGDLAMILVDKLPEGLKAVKTDTLIEAGSGGNPHKFVGGTFYKSDKQDDFVIGYLKASKTKLYHAEHGVKKTGSLKECSIPDGIYEIRKQNEITNAGMKPVVD